MMWFRKSASAKLRQDCFSESCVSALHWCVKRGNCFWEWVKVGCAMHTLMNVDDFMSCLIISYTLCIKLSHSCKHFHWWVIMGDWLIIDYWLLIVDQHHHHDQFEGIKIPSRSGKHSTLWGAQTYPWMCYVINLVNLVILVILVNLVILLVTVSVMFDILEFPVFWKYIIWWVV